MFLVARRRGQRIVIGNDIEVVVTELSRSVVRLGISAPASLQILRGEIRDSIIEANRNAAASEFGDVGELEATGWPVEVTTTLPVGSEVKALSLGVKSQAMLRPCSPTTLDTQEQTQGNSSGAAEQCCEATEAQRAPSAG